MKNLISMVDHSKFLKQLLELWMFVPCDENGNVLEEPKNWNDYLEFPESFDGNKEWYEFYAYEQAKERCLFDGFEKHEIGDGFLYLKSKEFTIIIDIENLNFQIETAYENIYIRKIEDLVKYNLQLTATAIKQIGL